MTKNRTTATVALPRKLQLKKMDLRTLSSDQLRIPVGGLSQHTRCDPPSETHQ